jgi:hypothetical protein
MQPIDYKYIGLISSHLPLFTRKRDGTYNCRCVICGDSKTNKRKKRAFLLAEGERVTYYCHNCNASLSLANLIKTVDPILHDEYLKERLAEKYSSKQVGITAKERDITKVVFPKYLREQAFKSLQKISSLRHDHPAKQYVDRRKIPTKHHHKLFLALKFKEWVNGIVPDKFNAESLAKDEPRLVIPYIDMDGSLIGFSGRSFDKNSKLRYITIAVDTNKPMVYGLDAINKLEKIYVTEGPIDSLFLPNALAMGSSNNLGGIKEIADVSKVVIVHDNEPKNKEICSIVEKAIDIGYNVCIWPSHIEQKDINEMVLSGMKPEDVKLTIDCNTFKGLQAKLKLLQWRKC